jgi:outer membrane protein with beta-barrel domain
MHRKAFTLAVCLLLAASVRDAAAQVPVGEPWTDRGYFNFSIGFDTGSSTLSDSRIYRLPNDAEFPEDGSLSFETAVDSGAMIDFAVGSRVWRNVSVGLGYHRGSNGNEGTVVGSIPHPVNFNQHRNVTVPIDELDRTESAIHLTVGYMFVIDEKTSVHVTIGPSFFRLSQEVASDITVTETAPPFTTVNVTPIITERTDSPVGFHIGVDGTYKVYENPNIKIGAGLFLRYAGASAKIVILDEEVETDVGGFQIGFGARFRF